MENNEAPTTFKPLADDAFLSLGAQQIAYVKAISLPDGAHAVGIFSADGAFDPQAVDVLRRSFIDMGLLKELPDDRALFTTRFVPVRPGM